jgi:hypothetical protein
MFPKLAIKNILIGNPQVKLNPDAKMKKLL